MNASENLISLSNTSSFLSQSLNANPTGSDGLDTSDTFGLGFGQGPSNKASEKDEAKDVNFLDEIQAPSRIIGVGQECQDQGANASGTGLLIDLQDEIQVPLPPAILTQAEVDDTFGIFSKPQTQSQRSEDGSSQTYQTASPIRSIPSNDSFVVHEHEGSFNLGTEDPAGAKAKEEENVKIVDITSKSISSISETSSYFNDARNLSSFSIPDSEMNMDEYLENIKKEDMAETAVSAAVVQQIKLDLLEDVERSPPPPSSRKRSSIVSFKLNSTRLSMASDFAEEGSRSSTGSGSVVEKPVEKGPGSKAVSVGGGGRGRLSSNFMNSSPIRASYPISKLYMPTPKSKTPSRLSSRDRHTSESLYSPSGTRNLLATGDLPQTSPVTKMQVRKSMSIETLHYARSPYTGGTLSVPKFSTPSASQNRRHSVSVHEENPSPRNQLNQNTWIRGDERQRFLFGQPRQGRLSHASSTSSTSINARSPNSSFSSVASSNNPNQTRDISHLANLMKDTHLTYNMGIRPLPSNNDSGAKPMKATAIISPTKEFTSEAQNITIVKNTTSNSTTRVTKGKYIPPVAASSPRLQPSPSKAHHVANHTTPTRAKYGVNVRSSGYGPQNLNTTFGSKPPLTSPNKLAPSATTTTSVPASIKQPVVPTMKGGAPQTKVQSRIPAETGIKGKSALPLPKILKAPTVHATSGLRRPTAGTVGNKENTARTTLTSKLGVSKPRH